MKQGLFTLGLSVALSIMAGCRSQQEGWKLVWGKTSTRRIISMRLRGVRYRVESQTGIIICRTSIPAILCAMAIWFCVD